IGVVHLYPQACGQLDSSQLAELASQAKHHAKNIQGYSIHVIDSQEAAASLGAQNLSEPLRDQSADRAASV
ncbi:diguanylate phosphodiesterase, partial [Pseudomonas sp. MWU13-2625]